jgi:acetylornithine deacetylase
MTDTESLAARAVEELARLVAFDTTSRGSNLELIQYAEDRLGALGARLKRVPNADGTKTNLWGMIGPEVEGGIVLSGHTDVVPVDGQPWTTDPWTLTDKGDGRLYGRGTCDMKGFIALALAAAPELAATSLSRPVHFAFSYDEEVGCLGVRGALERLKQFPVMPKGCVIGEPTSMQVTTAHKGKKSVRCHVHGHECHSSLAPQGVNAVEYAAEVIAHLKGMARRFASEGPFDHDYDVPYTTIHTGIVHGGTALNIVPKDCRFDFEFRYLPGEDPEKLLADVQRFAETKLAPEMKAVTAEAGFTWQQISAFPGLDTKDGEEIAVLAKALALSNATVKVAFGTEAGLVQQAGIPTVVCGPGSIEQAHKPDEFVAISQLVQCEAFMDRLVARLQS